MSVGWRRLSTESAGVDEKRLWLTGLQTVNISVPSYLSSYFTLVADRQRLMSTSSTRLRVERFKVHIKPVHREIQSHSYGTSTAVWDHTLLPATRHK